jgi:CRP-like cAMP-binding protein
MTADLSTRIRRFDLFAGLNDEERAAIATIMTNGPVKKGDTVFKQGDSGDAAFVILEGGIEIKVGGKSVTVIEKGGILGEGSLLGDLPRSATAIAASDGMLGKITRKDFQRLNNEGCLATYKICAKIAGTLVGRLNAMNKKLIEMMEANPPGREMDRLKSSLMKDWSF